MKAAADTSIFLQRIIKTLVLVASSIILFTLASQVSAFQPPTRGSLTCSQRHMHISTLMSHQQSTDNDDGSRYYTEAEEARLLILNQLIRRKTRETELLRQELKELQETKQREEDEERADLIAHLNALQDKIQGAIGKAPKDKHQALSSVEKTISRQFDTADKKDNNRRENQGTVSTHSSSKSKSRIANKSGDKSSSSWLDELMDSAEGFFLGDGRTVGAATISFDMPATDNKARDIAAKRKV
jgi:hypothetical protein